MKSEAVLTFAPPQTDRQWKYLARNCFCGSSRHNRCLMTTKHTHQVSGGFDSYKFVHRQTDMVKTIPAVIRWRGMIETGLIPTHTKVTSEIKLHRRPTVVSALVSSCKAAL